MTVTDQDLAFIASGGIRHRNHWDSLAFYEGKPLETSTNMFGNHNVGYQLRCSLPRGRSTSYTRSSQRYQ